ncbi:UNKNOWN [Stylonychia lemnae]|uniref:Uncharacterized protein n=1 Tax=Stylonychia lemnae TaxID=5949 RepID=A0A078BA19_STYLE|nr:UNKNOWN [Stylonychia lemnae]|eukprot:CDW91086.1 UNKNOWN [Stylonychia lemnae]
MRSESAGIRQCLDFEVALEVQIRQVLTLLEEIILSGLVILILDKYSLEPWNRYNRKKSIYKNFYQEKIKKRKRESIGKRSKVSSVNNS